MRVRLCSQVLALLCELLPPTPSPYVMVSDNQPLSALLEANSGSKGDARSQFFQAHPETAQSMVAKMAPLMIQLHSATVMPHVSMTFRVSDTSMMRCTSVAYLDELAVHLAAKTTLWRLSDMVCEGCVCVCARACVLKHRFVSSA